VLDSNGKGRGEKWKKERKGEGKERETAPPTLPDSLRHWVRRALRGVRTVVDLTWLEDFLTSK